MRHTSRLEKYERWRKITEEEKQILGSTFSIDTGAYEKNVEALLSKGESF